MVYHYQSNYILIIRTTPIQFQPNEVFTHLPTIMHWVKEAINMTDFEKMNVGELFNQTNKSLLFRMARTYCLVRKLNRTSLLNQPKRNQLLKKIFGAIDGNSYYVQSPLYIDYGFNTYVGKNLLSNQGVLRNLGGVLSQWIMAFFGEKSARDFRKMLQNPCT